MRRAALLLLAVLALTGCSTPIAGKATAAPAADIPALASAGAATPLVSTRDAIMVRVIRTGTSISALQIDDVRMISIAQYVCGVVGADSTRGGVASAIVSVSIANGIDYPDAGFIVGASVGNKCPQYTSLIG